MFINDKRVLIPKEKEGKWYCIICDKEVDIYDQTKSSFYNICKHCGNLYATCDLMKEKGE